MKMAGYEDVEKLDISKNLLQLNFMKRTLLAQERFARPKASVFTSVVDKNFPLKRTAVNKLDRHYEIVSKCPVTLSVPGLNGVPFGGYRKSFGGFNAYLEGLESGQSANVELETSSKEQNNKRKNSHNRKDKRNRKRKSDVENRGPAAKKVRK